MDFISFSKVLLTDVPDIVYFPPFFSMKAHLFERSPLHFN